VIRHLSRDADYPGVTDQAREHERQQPPEGMPRSGKRLLPTTNLIPSRTCLPPRQPPLHGRGAAVLLSTSYVTRMSSFTDFLGWHVIRCPAAFMPGTLSLCAYDRQVARLVAIASEIPANASLSETVYGVAADQLRCSLKYSMSQRLSVR
jgi:hypothetical protein